MFKNIYFKISFLFVMLNANIAYAGCSSVSSKIIPLPSLETITREYCFNLTMIDYLEQKMLDYQITIINLEKLKNEKEKNENTLKIIQLFNEKEFCESKNDELDDLSFRAYSKGLKGSALSTCKP